jgi:hypothetical protein
MSIQTPSKPKFSSYAAAVRGTPPPPTLCPRIENPYHRWGKSENLPALLIGNLSLTSDKLRDAVDLITQAHSRLIEADHPVDTLDDCIHALAYAQDIILAVNALRVESTADPTSLHATRALYNKALKAYNLVVQEYQLYIRSSKRP